MKTPLFLALAAMGSAALAADIDSTILVSATRLKAAAADQPVNLTVLSRTDLDRSTANNVAEALASVAGVNFRRLYGEGATLDLRGFGASGAANTRILLDGISLNDNDLTAPDLGGIPLDAVERIEIVKGGAVAWGGGTTGGVINIVTRGAATSQGGQLRAKLGSDDARELAGGLQLRQADWHLKLNARAADSDGYRANSRERNRAVLGELSWQLPGSRLALDLGHDQTDNRLPGTRTVDPATGRDDYRQDPRGSATPNDWANTRANRVVLRADGQAAGVDWAVDISRRSKDTEGFFDDYVSPAPYKYSTADRREGNESRLSPRLSLNHAAWGLEHELNAGIDLGRANSSLLTGQLMPSDWNGESHLNQRAVWFDHGTRLSSSTRITVGARWEHSKQEVATTGYDADFNRIRLPSETHRESPFAWQLGLRQTLDASWSLYAKLGRSFRLANADELAQNASLRPQRSRDAELGLEGRHGGFNSRLAVYRMNLQDEIHYQAYVDDFGSYGYFGRNVNLDPTRRQGVELESRWQGGALDIAANLSYTQAEFVAGAYNGIAFAGKTVPLVPRWKANLSAGWQLSDGDHVALSWRLVGKRWLDNDQINTAPQLAGFGLLDLKLSHRSGPWQLELSGQNLADVRYAEYGARSTGRIASGSLSTRYNVYPATGRQWWLGGSYRY